MISRVFVQGWLTAKRGPTALFWTAASLSKTLCCVRQQNATASLYIAAIYLYIVAQRGGGG